MGNRTLSNKQIFEIFQRFETHNQHPAIELDYSCAYTLLVAVVLSAQSTDKTVNRVTLDLFAVAKTPKEMVELGEDRLRALIKSIGLYNTKSKNIIALSKMLLSNFGGDVPDKLADLQKLPGVGRKSAKVLLNSFFHHPVIGVDTHVFRVANRIGLCSAKNVLKTEQQLEKNVPQFFKSRAHHWLVLHGRYICKARNFECERCIINDICQYEFKSKT